MRIWREYILLVNHDATVVCSSGPSAACRPIQIWYMVTESNIMSTPAEVRLARRVLRHELEAIRGNWAWFVALGAILIIVGTIAVGMPILSTLASAVVFGSLLLLGGIAQLVGAFWTRDWSGFFISLLMGVLYVVLGLMFLRQPIEAIEAMTLFLACALMVGGLFRIIGSLMYQFPHWGWTLVGGVINLTLGIMIWQQWPAASLWVIGLFIGIDLIFTGWTWVVLALSVKKLGPRGTAIHSNKPVPGPV
jgi:uncharacterized membrane protein HdeD (DUF308 family)